MQEKNGVECEEEFWHSLNMEKQKIPREPKKLFFILWFLSILGALAILPYASYLGTISSSALTPKAVLIFTLQVALFFGLICWFSYWLLQRTDLKPFSKPSFSFACLAGCAVGLSIYALDILIFKSTVLFETTPPLWTGLLGSFYGAIDEEVLLRLFLFTLIYYLCRKIFKFDPRHRFQFLWSINILVALAFGLGHLPATFQLITPTTIDIVRILFLNAIGGLVFGWLYWTRGIWSAMVAHFVADLVLHVLLI